MSLNVNSAMISTWRDPFRLVPLILCLFASCLAPATSRAAEAERYAYFFLQGKVTGQGSGRSEAGARIQLNSASGAFETTTDDRGVFVFEKLPVASYDLRIVTSGGMVMRSIRPFDDPRGIRLEIRTGRGEGKALHVDATAPSGRVTYDAPEHAPNWSRFWKEFGIIVGAAGIFAL